MPVLVMSYPVTQQIQLMKTMIGRLQEDVHRIDAALGKVVEVIEDQQALLDSVARSVVDRLDSFDVRLDLAERGLQAIGRPSP